MLPVKPCPPWLLLVAANSFPRPLPLPPRHLVSMLSTKHSNQFSKSVPANRCSENKTTGFPTHTFKAFQPRPWMLSSPIQFYYFLHKSTHALALLCTESFCSFHRILCFHHRAFQLPSRPPGSFTNSRESKGYPALTLHKFQRIKRLSGPNPSLSLCQGITSGCQLYQTKRIWSRNVFAPSPPLNSGLPWFCLPLPAKAWPCIFATTAGCFEPHFQSQCKGFQAQTPTVIRLPSPYSYSDKAFQPQVKRLSSPDS